MMTMINLKRTRRYTFVGGKIRGRGKIFKIGDSKDKGKKGASSKKVTSTKRK